MPPENHKLPPPGWNAIDLTRPTAQIIADLAARGIEVTPQAINAARRVRKQETPRGGKRPGAGRRPGSAKTDPQTKPKP